MSKKGWVKHFINGQMEIGTEDLIDQGKASWRSGNLKDILSVSVYENNYVYNLNSLQPSEWWQGDEYHARMSFNKTVPGELKKRFVQFKIEDIHVGKYVVPVKMPSMYRVLLRDNKEGALIQILPEHKDMWLTMYIEPDKLLPGLQLRKQRG